MFRKKDDKEINFTALNNLISLSNKTLNVMFVLLLLLSTYICFQLADRVAFFETLMTLLTLLSPFFIGIVIAWLLDPVVSFLSSKGLRRGIGSTICYFILIGSMVFIISQIIPLLLGQIEDFATGLQGNIDTVTSWTDSLFNKVEDLFGNLYAAEEASQKLEELQNNLIEAGSTFVTNVVTNLPNYLISVFGNILSGVGTFFIGLVIGFMLLVNFDKNADSMYSLIPRHKRLVIKEFVATINKPLKSFVKGALIDCSIIFFLCFACFTFVGLESPILFALFCAITNIIPYIGPYIGGVPAVLIAFTTSTGCGIGVLMSVVIIQFLEGNFLNPLIMSKTTNISPVLIILGLLVFGHYFGILGMILATPILASTKEILNYFIVKYNLIEENIV